MKKARQKSSFNVTGARRNLHNVIGLPTRNAWQPTPSGATLSIKNLGEERVFSNEVTLMKQLDYGKPQDDEQKTHGEAAENNELK